jgi:PAS domain S-box-containing protein
VTSFLRDGGETTALIRAFDWSATPLGPIEDWPQSLKTATALLLRSPVPIVMLWGPDGVMIYNDAYSVFAGGRHPQLLGSNVREGWPEVADFNDNVMKVGLAGGTLAYKDQELVLHRTGAPESVWMNLDYWPVPDENGAPAGVICTVVETTERVKADAALRASESRLRDLNADLERKVIERTQARGLTWQVSPDLLGALNSQGYFETSNPAWETMLGWTEEEVASMSIFELLHPDDVERTRAGFNLTQQGQPAIRFPNRYRCKNGGYRWISWVGVPEDGMVYCSGRDITEEKAQEAERDRLWTLSTDMLARADYQGGMSAVNPAWTRVLGWSQHELLTNPYADIIDPENVPATVAALEEMGRTGRPTRFQNRILAKDGTWKPIDWTVAPEPDGRNFIAVGRDLTSDKARESELAEAQSALRQAQKMEAVGQLTGGIAHDFNNLLAGISGSLEMLEKRLGEGRLSGVDRYIEVAQSSARRAASLTQRLLAFSRRQTLDPKPTDINRLVAGMEDLIRRSVGPEIEVEVVGAGGLWLTRVDPSQLENALLNLTINGRDAMPDGGRLTIETANKWLDQRAAGDRDLPPGQYVSLCVTDTGTGMTPDVIDRAFDPFFTTKPLGQGTGLGLSMIHGFARQSGGQVRIYSEVGKGTTMCLYFPRFVGQLEAVEAPDAHAGAEEGHGETVLVIDDEDAIRMLVTDVLEEAGYRVLSASDGGGGLKILQSDARIDLLITDVGLPGGVNGRQVADAARTTRPELKVLFITGYAENAVVGNGHLDAGMQVITKPFAMSVLGARVREIIES